MSAVAKEHKGITRREFVKGAATAGASVAGVGAFAGHAAAAPAWAPPPPEKFDFEVPPEPISQSDIKETVATDVVVVGAGNAGMVAAIVAAQEGARVVMLQKRETFTIQAGDIGLRDSVLSRALAARIDRDEVIHEICRYSAYRNDQRLVALWADKSGEWLDWARPIMEEGGLLIQLETDVKEGYFKHFPTMHRFVKPGATVLTGAAAYMPVFEKKALELGVEIRYETPAVQLIREGKGRVTGVVAQNKAGDYIQFNAAKGVVLCAGGYQGNPDMLKAYCPRAYYYSVAGGMPDRTGDGIKMGIWVGAAIDQLPHAPMQFDSGQAGPDGAGYPFGGGPNWWRQPFLHVNQFGERFVDEDLPYQYVCNAGSVQAGHLWWKIWDDNWEEDIRRFHTTICARILPHPMGSRSGVTPTDLAGLEAAQAAVVKAQGERMATLIEQGYILKADTLEELAQKMNVPVETFLATVTRYNELARLGKDLDFGKVPHRLSTLEKPPFYCNHGGAALLSTLNGLCVNTKQQVLDTEFLPIPGLYAAGDNAGSFFANDYPQICGGLALGRTMTFARLAGINVAAEQV